MAWTKEKAVNQTLAHLKKCGIEKPEYEIKRFITSGYTEISGYNCRVANVLKGNDFRVRVCNEWFQGLSDAKPRIRTSSVEFEYQLLPTKKYLYAIYYLALRDYAFQLEDEKDKWFLEPNWGMIVNQDLGVFTWKGKNQLQFPLLVLSSPLDLDLRAKQYLSQMKLIMTINRTTA